MFPGRIGRLGFFVGGIYLYIPLIFIIIGYASVNYFAGGINNIPVAPWIVFFIGAIWTIAYFLIGLDLVMRRLHDMNQSGWWAIFLLLPPANTVLGIVLLFIPGTNGPNRYGMPVKGLAVAKVLFHKYPQAVTPPPSGATQPPETQLQ
jgi:uncharacterized membrane protein YhaH (DUF805 family)